MNNLPMSDFAELQQRVDQFIAAREWRTYNQPKDILLGIVEEIGELRNIIKWEQDPAIIQQALLDNKKDVEDGVADILFLLAQLANFAGVDMEKALADILEKNETRFPVGKNKNVHNNTYLGGADQQLAGQ